MYLLNLIRNELCIGPLATLEARLYSKLVIHIQETISKRLKVLAKDNKIDMKTYSIICLVFLQTQGDLVLGETIKDEDC